jgi:hypothetical protein
MHNIDEFNWYTAQILSLLYQNFPIPLSVDHESLSDQRLSTEEAWERDIENIVINGNPDAKRRTSEFLRHTSIAWHTIRWLNDCDYIRTNEKVDHGKWQVNTYVLSPKGLEVLSIVPESLEIKKTYGERLKEATGKTAGEAGRAAIGEIVGSVITAVWRSSGLGF